MEKIESKLYKTHQVKDSYKYDNIKNKHRSCECKKNGKKRMQIIRSQKKDRKIITEIGNRKQEIGNKLTR